MLTFILVLPNRDGEIVDTADSPDKLDFSKVANQTCYEISIRCGGEANTGGSVYPLAAVNLIGYEDQAEWIFHQLCKEIDLRRTFTSFEAEVKQADRPLITFG